MPNLVMAKCRLYVQPSFLVTVSTAMIQSFRNMSPFFFLSYTCPRPFSVIQWCTCTYHYTSTQLYSSYYSYCKLKTRNYFQIWSKNQHFSENQWLRSPCPHTHTYKLASSTCQQSLGTDLWNNKLHLLHECFLQE